MQFRIILALKPSFYHAFVKMMKENNNMNINSSVNAERRNLLIFELLDVYVKLLVYLRKLCSHALNEMFKVIKT